MKKLRLIFLTFLLLPAAGALEITGCRIMPDGRTGIFWKDGGDKYVMVYRYTEKLTPKNIFFAERTRCDASAGSCMIVPKTAGSAYYMLTSCDRFGKETRDFSIQYGPVAETAAYTLPPVEFRVEIRDDQTFLAWDPLPLEYRGMIRKLQLKTRSGKVIAEAPGSALCFPLPPAAADGDEYYTVAALGNDGRCSDVKKFFRYGSFPDFMISPAASVVKNDDVSLQHRYPVTGRKTLVRFRITNCGGKAGSATVKIPGITEKTISLDAHASTEVSGFWQPETRGRHLLSVDILCPNDRQMDNNSLKLELFAVDKPLWFIWYGKAADLDYATAGSDAPEYWRRIGGRQLRICVRNETPDSYRLFLNSKPAPGGLQYDELGGNIEPEKYINALRELRKTHPDAFIALWHIGADPKPAVVEALKDGTIDLIMPERYHTFNSPMEESLKKDIARLRALGILDKCIIGLGTHRNYAGFGSAAEHIAYLEKQIALIREFAPESPGMAFYNDAALPGVREAVDRMCRKYFLERKEEKK